MTSLTNHASTANRRLLIMYGSQTGVAESIAKSLHEKIVLNNTSQNNSNIEAVIVECNKYKRTGLKNGLFDEKRVIIVCSTTGNADAPDNCDRFWRYIKRRSHPSDLLKGLEYCVLGLGDTNYDKFCYMGEMIDKRMSELGAHRFYHLGKADDAVGLETVVEPWIDGLLQIVNTQEDDNNNINNNNNNNEKKESNNIIGQQLKAENTSQYDEMVNDNRLLIMYGSQTGVAESIAKSLHEKIVLNNTSQNNSNIEAVIVECNKYKRTGLKNGLFDEKRVIIVCSTTGNADAPDNCDRFWRYIKRRSHPSDLLKGLEYCVLGLGDTNYDKFCYMGEMIDKRMSELGAHRFYHLGKADDAVGLETVVEPWIDGLLQIVNTQEDDNNNINNNNNGSSNDNSINKNNIIDTNGDDINFCPLQPKDSSLKTLVENVDRTTSAMPRVPSCDFNVVYSDLIYAEKDNSGLDNSAPNSPINNSDTGRKWALSNPCNAKIVGARYLTKGGSKAERRVIHLDIQLPLQMQGSSVRRDSFNNAVPALKYAPGDAVGIICPNNTKLINWLLKRLGLYKFADKYFELQRIGAIGASKRAMRQATKAMSIPMHHRTPRLALTHHVDFSGPIRRSTIKKFACFCSDNKERLQMEKLGGPEGREEYTLLIEQQKAGFAEVLAMFPSCKPSIDSILNILPSLMPRYYSIASSPLDDPAIMSIAFTVLEYEIRIPKATSGEWTHGGEYEDHDIFVSKRKGLCTTWLEEICGPFLSQQNNNVASLTHPELSIFVREAKEFILPASTKWPLIFVGPGTGVAPFVGFLLHRAALKQKNEAEKDDVCSGYWRMGFEIEDEIEEDVGLDIATGLDIGIDDEEYGPIHLFFGNRNKDQDFLYEEELKRLKTDGVLSSLHTAFSRDQEKKIYVQDRMKENGGKIAKIILQDNGYFYVCGDGAKMAYDVDRALIDIIVTHGNKYFRNQQEEVMNVYDNDGNLTAEMAKYILKDMKERQRYVKDVWS